MFERFECWFIRLALKGSTCETGMWSFTHKIVVRLKMTLVDASSVLVPAHCLCSKCQLLPSFLLGGKSAFGGGSQSKTFLDNPSRTEFLELCSHLIWVIDVPLGISLILFPLLSIQPPVISLSMGSQSVVPGPRTSASPGQVGLQLLRPHPELLK